MNTKRKVRKWIIIALALIVLLIIGYLLNGGYQIYSGNIQKATNERTSDKILTEWLTNDKGFDITAFEKKYKIESIEIKSSYDGHSIPAEYIYAEGNKDKKGNTVIMVHGLLGNRLSNYPMSQMFLEQGYNVITYDQRSSGKNTALYTTFGYLESKDTVDYVQYALDNMAEESILGVWGQSMGAATVENAMDENVFAKAVDFVVLDSPMGNMEDMLARRDIISQGKVFCASLINKIKQGYLYSDQRVYPQIENTKIPVLVVSSTNDNSIPYGIQESIYKCIKGSNKDAYIVNDSKHSDIYFDHPAEYKQRLKEFIKKHVAD